MARGYYASRLSAGRSETPEGFLIVPGCVIARTGFQSYQVKDLPQEAAGDLGVDLSNPSASIDIYRHPDDVFDPATIASFEGKPVTDEHPPDFINPENFKKYACGHIQNVRKGDEPLDDGEWPLLADVIITAEPLLGKVKRKEVEELSAGYDYALKARGKKICMASIRGNHEAVVPRGRAGHEARINDAAPSEPAATPPRSGNGLVVSKLSALLTTKESKPVMKNLRKHIWGLGLRAAAQDADIQPEQLAELAPPDEADDKKKSRDEWPDEGSEVEVNPADDKKRGKDKKKSRDVEPEEEEEEVEDSHRKRMHDALDRKLDAEDKRGRDTDLEELKSLLSEFFSEEEEEPAHAKQEELPVEVEDAEVKKLDDILGLDPEEEEEADDSEEEADDSEEEEEEAEDDEGEPGMEVVESGEEELEPADDKKKGRARDAKDGAAAVLKLLRPVVARSNDAAVVNAFNAALGSVKRSSKASTGSYGKFAGSARAHDSKTGKANDSGADAVAKLQAFYDNAAKGDK